MVSVPDPNVSLTTISQPPLVFTRLTGGAVVNKITIDNTTGFPVSSNLYVS